MDARWIMAWLFLGGCVVSALLTIPLYGRPAMVPEIALLYLRDVGIAFAGPLGIVIPALFAQQTPFSAIGRQQAVFAVVVSILWSLVPVAIGLYASFAPHIDDLQSILTNFNTAAIPANGVLVAVLAALFPKAGKPAASAGAAPADG